MIGSPKRFLFLVRFSLTKKSGEIVRDTDRVVTTLGKGDGVVICQDYWQIGCLSHFEANPSVDRGSRHSVPVIIFIMRFTTNFHHMTQSMM